MIGKFITDLKAVISFPTLFFFFLFVPSIFLVVGCGKKAKTEVTFRPNVLPAIFKCSRQNDGLWMVGGGVVTQYGIISLEQTFDTRDEYTYLVLRNRQKGIDQVFKLGVKGYVEIHTLGEHKLRIQRDENKVVVDVETISGTFDINVFPDSQAIARIELGSGQPDLVVFTDKRLTVEYDSVFWKDDSLPLDSIQSISFQKGLYSRSCVFKWKDDVKNQTTPFVLSFSDMKTAEGNFLVLKKTVEENAPHIRFERVTNKGAILSLIFVAVFFGVILGASILMTVTSIKDGRTGKAVFGCFLCLVTFFGFVAPLLFLAGDADAVLSFFG